MSGNEQQIEYWNGEAGERWAERQTRMDAMMTAIATAALAFAAARPGERALDIGCGCGTTTLALAEAVGPAGAVTGVDVSHPMVAHARARAADAGSAATFVEADASDFAFKPEHDLVFSRFGVMFFADPASAFANIRTALKPGGRLRFACWRAPAENAWATAPHAAVKDLLPPQEPPDPTAPGPFAFADGERLARILTEAGFSKVRLEKLDTAMNLGKDIEVALEQTLKVGPCARAILEIDPAQKDEVIRRIREVLAKFQTPAGIAPPAACWLVAGEA